MIVNAIIAAVISILSFLGHKWAHNYLDKEFNKNPFVPEPNGNGKNLSLSTINGIGFRLMGQYRKAQLGEYNSCVSYYMFCIFFIPIGSIRCYRVIPTDEDSYYVLGSERTDFRELGCLYLSVIGWLAAVATIIFIIASF